MDISSGRHRANRGIAALSEAFGPILTTSPLLHAPNHTRSTCVTRPAVTRYQSFDDMKKAIAQPDPLAVIRAELDAKKPLPPPLDETAAWTPSILLCISSFLPPLSRDAVQLAATCRRLRCFMLEHSVALDAVITPSMIPAHALVKAATLASVRATLRSRCHQVRRLVFIDSSSGGEATPTISLPSQPIAYLLWGLHFLAELPYLTELDLRGLEWRECANSNVLPSVLRDLHVANAGSLTTLKIGVEVMRLWTVKWWEHHPNLTTLVVGSRNDPVCATNTTAGSTHAPTVMQLPDDFFTFLTAEGRRLHLQLWCPLHVASVQRLLVPPPGASYNAVQELLVNLLGNEAACRPLETVVASASESVADGKPAKMKKLATTPEIVEVMAYPELESLSVAAVHQRLEGAGEVYARMMTMAPKLTSFTIFATRAAVAPSGKAAKAQNRKE